ncbi:MAG: hypothetical protein KA116_07970 [Proteobacteria bacterium]|nr:hypothetical protein [Pseudomonadota bacterium]
MRVGFLQFVVLIFSAHFSAHSRSETLIQVITNRSVEAKKIQIRGRSEFGLPELNSTELENIWELGLELLRYKDVKLIVENLRKHLINSKKSGYLEKSERKSLFLFRMRLKYIRSLCQVICRSSSFPDDIHDWARDLGRLLDYDKNDNSEGVQVYSRRLFEELTYRNFKNLYIKLKKAKLRNGLETWQETFRNELVRVSDRKNISLKEFHELRKMLDRQLALMEALRIYKPQVYNRTLYNKVLRLHRRMGKIHNVYVGDVCQGVLLYSQVEFEWSDFFRDEIKEILKFFD